MAPKLIILLYIYSKQPHYNMVSLITRSASVDPRDSVIMRHTCDESERGIREIFLPFQGDF